MTAFGQMYFHGLRCLRYPKCDNVEHQGCMPFHFLSKLKISSASRQIASLPLLRAAAACPPAIASGMMRGFAEALGNNLAS